jgi:translocation protein SEC62
MSSSTSKKSKKQLKEMEENEGGVAELTKEETQIARFLRLNCPNKQGNLVGMKVNFFIANKLVDCLMESKWGPNQAAANKNNNKQQTLFSNRQACVSFMQRLMNKQLFYRVVKVYKEPSAPIANKEGSTDSNATPSNLRKRKAVKETDTNNDTPNTNTPSNKDKDNNQTAAAKRKFKLEMHETQTFVDANEPYVWIYDPTSTTTYIIGFLLILGSIGICLFPLWPSQVREGVYYLSLAGISVLGAILGLAAFKYVLFAFLWLVTFGKLHFWLFPNLTEDVGFLESFVPVYKIESPKENSLTDKQKKSINETEKSVIKENDENEKSSKDLTTSQVKSSNTPSSIKASIYELSKSTVEVTSTGSDSPLLLTKSTRKQNDEEDFELVGDDDLVKDQE